MGDADRGVENEREFLQKPGASRFDSGKSHESLIRDCAGFQHKDLFLFNDVGFKKACAEFDARQVATELKKRGLLAVNDGYRFKSKHTLSGL